MKGELISFETAKLAKEKGFPQETCISKYTVDGESKFTMNALQPGEVDAPTQSLLQKWLREVHNCIVEIRFHSPYNEEKRIYATEIKSKKELLWVVEIFYYGKNFENTSYSIKDESEYREWNLNTYEEALEKGLQEALKLIK